MEEKNESDSNDIDYSAEIKKLEKDNPEFNLKYSLKDKGVGAGISYMCSLWKNGNYYAGIRGPCSLKDCYNLLKGNIEKERSNDEIS